MSKLILDRNMTSLIHSKIDYIRSMEKHRDIADTEISGLLELYNRFFVLDE